MSSTMLPPANDRDAIACQGNAEPEPVIKHGSPSFAIARGRTRFLTSTASEEMTSIARGTAGGVIR